MGKMKEIYTELQEQGIDPATVDISEWLKENKRLGEIDDLPEFLVDRIRNDDPNKEFTEAVQQEFQHAKSVLLQKHKDYGPKNISQTPGGPLNGLRVRMWDKLARINHLIDTGATPENESLRDSFLDMANYSIIAMMVLEGTWPNE
jgi:Nucleotide modification associated domain 1